MFFCFFFEKTVNFKLNAAKILNFGGPSAFLKKRVKIILVRAELNSKKVSK